MDIILKLYLKMLFVKYRNSQNKKIIVSRMAQHRQGTTEKRTRKPEDILIGIIQTEIQKER